jgi:dipeptidyl aminopeptidase/acylaminoacyl peptidase
VRTKPSRSPHSKLGPLNLRTFKAERLFRSDRESYEYFVAWLDPAAGSFVTRRESPVDPPQFFVRTLAEKPLEGSPAGEATFKSTSQALFGFQNERRTYWQARDTYVKLSPVMQADKINEPLLLIHGELDQNPGTVPMQSEKLYEAVRGVGGTVRLVMLPYESHGYTARESIERVLYEMLTWFDRYVKNASPRAK